MKASDLSPRLLSFLCLRNHVGGRNDNDKKADVIFHLHHVSPPHQVPFIFTFFSSLLCHLMSNLFASGATLACLPSLTKDLFLFRFFGIPQGKVGLKCFFLNFWLAGCVFNKSACQPYLPTVPFWRSWCTATLRLPRVSQSLDLTIALLFSSLCLPWPWGALFFCFDADSLSLPSLCKKKETSSVPKLGGGCFWIPEGQVRVERTCHSLVLSFRNFGYEL